MNDPVSSAAMQELFSDSPSLVAIYLFTISHPGLDAPIHLCNDKADHTVNGVTFKGTSFTFSPPDKSETKINGDAQLAMTIVDQSIPSALIDLREYPVISCTGALIRATGEIEEVEDWEFAMKEAKWSGNTLTASLIFESYLDTTFPGNTFDSDTCPGCWV